MPDPTQTSDFDEVNAAAGGSLRQNVDSTINLLQQELSSVDTALAINIIERWQHQLQGTDLFAKLTELKQAIFNGNLTELENRLQEVGEETSAIAASVREDGAVEVAAQVEQISKLLSQASQNVK